MTRTRRRRLPTAVAALALVAACGGVPQRGAPPSDQTPSIRFAIEVAPGAAGPVWVSLNDESAQPGWLTVSGPAGRAFLRERCEIPECGEDPAVCGAALPMVVDLTRVTDRSIELVWDGVTSFVDSSTRCETRGPAPSGVYTARFCHSREAEIEPGADPSAPAPGRVVRPDCVDLTFTLEDRDVVLRI